MESVFEAHVQQLKEVYGADAVSARTATTDVCDRQPDAAMRRDASSLPALVAAVTLVGTCEVTLAPSDLADSADDDDAADETDDRLSRESQGIRELTERYATTYFFGFRSRLDTSEGDEAHAQGTEANEPDAGTTHVHLDPIEDVTLPAAALAKLASEVEETLETFEHDPVAVVFALEAAQQSAQALHEAEAVKALREEAKRTRRAVAQWRALHPRTAVADDTPPPGALGRRCVYFHHIFCTQKRANMSAWCQALECFALCKIGYPGFLILEGSEASCTEYVRRLQGLHWKHMEVRGEEIVPVNTADVIDKVRAIPPRTPGVCLILDGQPCSPERWPSYVETTSAAEMGAWCQACSLSDLFRTGMRIYRSV